MTPALKTSRRLLLCNIVWYTFPKTAVGDVLKVLLVVGINFFFFQNILLDDSLKNYADCLN